MQETKRKYHLPFDYCRCSGNNCSDKIKNKCIRFTETVHSEYQSFANLAQDRVTSSSQCLHFISNKTK